MAKTDDNRVFVDTNVLLSATDTDRPQHADALEFLEAGRLGHLRLFASNQIFREYLVVATRPLKANGLGLSPEKAASNINLFRRVIAVLPETPETTSALLGLVKSKKLKGKRIHDANLVAIMQQHGLQRLKTCNPQDFSPFPKLVLV